MDADLARERDAESGVEPGGMTDAREDLRETSESIQDDAQRLLALETEKAALDPADPRVVVLAHEIEQLARNQAQKTTAERAITEEIRDGEVS